MSQGDVVPDDTTVDIILGFRCVLDWFRSVGSCHVQCFGVALWIWSKDCTLAPAIEKNHWGRRRWKIWLKYYVFFNLDLFHV